MARDGLPDFVIIILLSSAEKMPGVLWPNLEAPPYRLAGRDRVAFAPRLRRIKTLCCRTRNCAGSAPGGGSMNRCAKPSSSSRLDGRKDGPAGPQTCTPRSWRTARLDIWSVPPPQRRRGALPAVSGWSRASGGRFFGPAQSIQARTSRCASLFRDPPLYPTKPRPAKPTTNIAHVESSGTAAAETGPAERAVADTAVGAARVNRNP
jgi:hypothetical protein